MSITVRDVLKLDLFKSSTVLAGKNGLNRVVKRVSVFDCPIQVERDLLVLKEGDFFLSNFYFWKDNYSDAIFALNFLNSKNCSCLCLTNEYIKYFTEEMIELCNEINFPILSIDYSISYGDVMTNIYPLMMDKQRNTILEMQLTNLIANKNLIETNKMINEINPHFKSYITAIYCYSTDSNFNFSSHFINTINTYKQNICIPYKKGLLIFLTYNNLSNDKVITHVNYYVELIKNNISNYVIGISNNNISIRNIQEAISQSILSCTFNSLKSNSVIYYNDLGSFSFLLSFKDSSDVKSIYNNTIIPIIEYDMIHNKDLLQTLITFVECFGDYKKTSQYLYQHENTIRYRILKIRSLLHLDNSIIEFYEKISLGVKLHKIYS